MLNYINHIITGDCVAVLAKLPARAVDFILTDPPYLVNYRDRYGRTIRGDRFSDGLLPTSKQLYRLLKPHRFMVSFYGWQAADRFLAAWRSAGFYPVGHLVWPKRYASSEHFLRYQHEQAYLLAKGQPALPLQPLPDVLPWRYTGNRLHPTQKPIEALLPLIRAFTRPADLVLDPFAGSGTTCLAARLLDCRYLGIELDPTYAAIARKRLSARPPERRTP